MLRPTAVRRKSWKIFTPIPVSPQAFFQTLSNRFTLSVPCSLRKRDGRNSLLFFSMTTDGLKCFFSSSSRYLILESAFFDSPTSSRTISSRRSTWLQAKLAISEIRHPDRFAKTIKSLMCSGSDSFKAMNSQLD